jgi:tellurite resistance-related uncharacterized protein
MLKSNIGMKLLPSEVKSYKKTPEVTASTILRRLLNACQTKEGKRGKIVVISGQLRFRILAPELESLFLFSESYGILEPTVFCEIV